MNVATNHRMAAASSAHASLPTPWRRANPALAWLAARRHLLPHMYANLLAVAHLRQVRYVEASRLERNAVALPTHDQGYPSPQPGVLPSTLALQDTL